MSHLIGKIDRLNNQIRRGARGDDDPANEMVQLVFERILLAGMIERSMALCEIQLDPAEYDRIIAENKRRTPISFSRC